MVEPDLARPAVTPEHNVAKLLVVLLEAAAPCPAAKYLCTTALVPNPASPR